MVLMSYALLLGGGAALVRERILGVVPAISLVFAIMSALLLALMRNAVFGLREKHREQTRRVLKLAWQAEDEYGASDDPAVRKLLDERIALLLSTPAQDYQEPENYVEWWDDVEPSLDQLRKSPNGFRLFYRYLLPLEHELNELGMLCIRRHIVDLHLKTLRESFALVIAAICLVALGGVLPTGDAADISLAVAAIGVVVLAPVQLAVVLSYLWQEAREETISVTEKDDD